MGSDEESADLPVFRGEENAAVRIKLEREARGWGTNALSDRLVEAGFEMNPSAVWRIENRKRRVNLDEAIGFAEVFGISLESLIGPPKMAQHARAMELVEQIRRAFRETQRANLAFSEARDALDRYLDEHPDIYEEVDNAVKQAIAEEIADNPDSPWHFMKHGVRPRPGTTKDAPDAGSEG
ncbi:MULTISPECIES: helix-turn-helix transcriptional regulator [unclassified Streptomyces]|uniref:helix-turn-helix transcriptional regulator n=1 Tax=unclassified Streptomyces TaxID=2593676 RepID=UPI0021B09C05|nr:helix-turn-helix transcriptional regulator [Streptomyces sp. BHT-5-2]